MCELKISHMTKDDINVVSSSKGPLTDCQTAPALLKIFLCLASFILPLLSGNFFDDTNLLFEKHASAATHLEEEKKENDFERQHISVNIGGLLSGTADISIQHRISRPFAIIFAPTLIYWGYGDDMFYGGGAGLGFDYFPFSSDSSGLHLRTVAVATYIEIMSIANKKAPADISRYGLGAKMSVAYSWQWEGGLSFTMGLGIQGYDIDDRIETRFDGILPALEIGLGYIF